MFTVYLVNRKHFVKRPLNLSKDGVLDLLDRYHIQLVQELKGSKLYHLLAPSGRIHVLSVVRGVK